jgi:hypothetical protein
MGKEIIKTEENENVVTSFSKIIQVALDKDVEVGYVPINRVSPELGSNSHFVTHAAMLAANFNTSEECLRGAIDGFDEYNKYVDKISTNLMPITNLAYLLRQFNDSNIFITGASIAEMHLDYELFKEDPRFDKFLVALKVIPAIISLLNNCWNNKGELCVTQSCFTNISSIICFQFLLIIVQDFERNELIRLIDGNVNINKNIDGVIRLAREEIENGKHAAKLISELRTGINDKAIILCPKATKWSMDNLIETRKGGFETKIRRASKVLSTF